MNNFKSLLGEYLQGFLDFRVAQGYSKTTYIGTLRSIDKFYSDNYPIERNLTPSIVHEWIKSNSGCSVSNLHQKVSVIRLLGRYMSSYGINPYIIPDKFIPDRRRNSAYIFSDIDLFKLFKTTDKICIKGNPFATYQLPVIFRLIYTCGLRPQEGRLLQWKNVNVNTGEILITHTKRNKERIVVMSDEMLSLYKRYDNIRQCTYPDSIYAFPNTNGESYTSSCLRKYFNKCWRQSNPDIPKSELTKVRIYDLRHRFASAVLNQWLDEKKDLGAMIPYLQAYMGHDLLSSTAGYIHMLPENLVKSPGVDWESMRNLIPEVNSK